MYRILNLIREATEQQIIRDKAQDHINIDLVPIYDFLFNHGINNQMVNSFILGLIVGLVVRKIKRW